MFNLGFSMEELMFPENSQSSLIFNMETNFWLDKISSSCDYQERNVTEEDDDDDDWFTIKQLHSNFLSTNNDISLVIDQALPISNAFLDYHYQANSRLDLDGINHASLVPNLSNHRSVDTTRDRKNTSSITETTPCISSSSLCNQRLLMTTTNTRLSQQPMSRSTSSLSFCTKSSTSMASSSTDDVSPHSDDCTDAPTTQYSTESLRKYSDHYKSSHSSNDEFSNGSNRRRRKRTIFSAADIDNLKEAFILNPKPNQQEIAVLSEQLGHDSYVIRVWFYNKRQASKKRMD